MKNGSTEATRERTPLRVALRAGILIVALMTTGCPNAIIDKIDEAITSARQLSLTLEQTDECSTTPLGDITVRYGVPQLITAIPAAGYTFSHWEAVSGPGQVKFDDSSHIAATVSLTGGSATVRPVCVLSTYTLNVVSDGNGSVSPSPSAQVTHGIATSITAVPTTAGFHFKEWTITGGSGVFFDETPGKQVSGNANAKVTLTGGNATIRATFSLNDYTLQLDTDGHGSIVQPSAGASVSATVASGTPTPIEATPGTGYDFVAWTIVSPSPPTGVSIASASSALTAATLTATNAQLRATFALKNYALSLTNDGHGSASGPSTAAHGVAAQISASPATGYDFNQWTTASPGVSFVNATTAASQTAWVTLTSGAATIQATFRLKSYTLAVAASPSAGGTVSADASSILHGQSTTVRATPAAGYDFLRWDVSGSAYFDGTPSKVSTTTQNPVVTLLGNSTATAVFQLKTYQLSVVAGANGSIGTPTSSPVGVTHGAATTIGASAADGYVFDHWTTTAGSAAIADSNSAVTTVSLTAGNATVQALFKEWAGQATIATPYIGYGGDSACVGTKLYTVWYDQGKLNYRASANMGMTWLTQQTVATDATNQMIRVAVNNDVVPARIYVAYLASATSDYNLKFVAFDENQTSGFAPVTVTTGVGPKFDMAYSRYTNTLPYIPKIVISYYDAANLDLKIAKSRDGTSGTWYQEAVAFDSTTDFGAVSALASYNGTYYIAYSDNTNNKILVLPINVNPDNGASNLSPVRTAFQESAAISDISAGRVSTSYMIIAYRTGATGLKSVSSSTFFTAPAASSVTVDATNGCGYTPKVAMGTGGIHFVAYTRYYAIPLSTTYYRAIKVARTTDQGASWEATSSFQSSTADYPRYYGSSVCTVGSRVYVTWVRRTNGTTDYLYLRKSTDSGATYP
jgi:hypothetical protein